MISEISTVKEMGEVGATIILIMGGLVVFTVLIICAFFKSNK